MRGRGRCGDRAAQPGTPRIANRLLKRVRDFAQVLGNGVITREIADEALRRQEIDQLGLDAIDRRMLTTIIRNYGGGPVGLETLAAAIGEESVTLEDVYEPYLMQIGFLSRTPRGRCATPLAYEHLGLTPNGVPSRRRRQISSACWRTSKAHLHFVRQESSSPACDAQATERILEGTIGMGRIFGTDGIRGVAGVDMTPELALDLGRAAATVVKERGNTHPHFLIGRDTRISGGMLESAIAAGLCSVGADVTLLGVITTPGVAYLARKYQADGSLCHLRQPQSL